MALILLAVGALTGDQLAWLCVMLLLWPAWPQIHLRSSFGGVMVREPMRLLVLDLGPLPA